MSQVDFTNHPLKRQSIIDYREINLVNPSIIESYTSKFRLRFNDPTFDNRMTAKIIQHLSEQKIEELADYIDRKATTHKGRAFASLCYKNMQTT